MAEVLELKDGGLVTPVNVLMYWILWRSTWVRMYGSILNSISRMEYS